MAVLVKVICRKCGGEQVFVPLARAPHFLPSCCGKKMEVTQVRTPDVEGYSAYWAGMRKLGYQGPGGPKARRFQDASGLTPEQIRKIGRKALGEK